MLTTETRVTVLLVDDDRGVLESYERMLRLEGYVVVSAASADEGLRAVATHHPDAILLDLRMPLTDGLGFLRRLREQEVPHRTPIAVVTGDYLIDEATVADLKALGADVRFKPLWLEDLIVLVGSLLADAGH